MTPEQIELARRVTLIVYEDGSKVCRYDQENVVEQGVRMVAYPEISKELLEEIQNDSTTLKRVREILDSLTNL